jgi:N utilization substance protein B
MRQKGVEIMINREIIRLKVVQMTYAYYQNDGKTPDEAEKELTFSLEKTYELYITLLQLLVELKKVGDVKLDVVKSRADRLGTEAVVNERFANSKFILQLSQNKELAEKCEELGIDWSHEEKFIRSLYDKITASEFYKKYMAHETTTYEEDREFWRLLYRKFICGNVDLEQILEEKSLYWNDDKFTVDSFVMKTVKHIEEKEGVDSKLLVMYESDDDRIFATKLFRKALLNEEFLRGLISENSSEGWDFSRLALMDVIIMQVALAEIINFPDIPVDVTFNEYLEIAKLYSTQRSPAYINGILDAIVQKLKAEKKIKKTEPKKGKGASKKK